MENIKNIRNIEDARKVYHILKSKGMETLRKPGWDLPPLEWSTVTKWTILVVVPEGSKYYNTRRVFIKEGEGEFALLDMEMETPYGSNIILCYTAWNGEKRVVHFTT